MAQSSQHLASSRTDQFVVFDDQYCARTRSDFRRQLANSPLFHGHLALGLVRENMADFPGQLLTAVRLAQEFDPAVESTAMHDGVLGVARGEQNREIG